MTHILLVDDEEAFCTSLQFTLSKEGYRVTLAVDGIAALESALAEKPDVVLLDLMLPGMDGMEVCRRLRETSDVPILMLTAKDAEADKVAGLEAGADDYLTKPFGTRELVARVRAVLRRRAQLQRLIDKDQQLLDRLQEIADLKGGSGRSDGATSAATESSRWLKTGSLQLDILTTQAFLRGERLDLTVQEFQGLRLLITERGRVVTRSELCRQVWGYTSPDNYLRLEVLVRRLRGLLEADPLEPRHLITVPGIGYCLEQAP